MCVREREREREKEKGERKFKSYLFHTLYTSYNQFIRQPNIITDLLTLVSEGREGEGRGEGGEGESGYS